MRHYLGSLLRQARTFKGMIALGISSFLLIIGINMSKAIAQPSVPMNKAAAAQIQALVQEKRSRTPAQQKISSAILYAIRTGRGDSITKLVPKLKSSVEVTPGGIRVDIKTSVQITTELLEKIKATGAEILSALPDYNAIQVLVPLDKVESLASFPEVKSIRHYIKPTTYRQSVLDSKPAQRISALPQMLHLVASQATLEPITNVGGVTSEGDVAHTASLARIKYKVDGTGVKIGILSDSYDNLAGAAADIASGDLPSDGVTLVGSGDLASGGDDEGRAMLQIVHDLAPGAQLYFATAFNSEADLANNIRALRQAGCDIIVDDVFYYDEPEFQDGIVAQAVNDVTASGALYFSSAGNGGNKQDGTSGVWQGDFVNGGLPPLGLSGSVHKFGTGSLDLFNRLTNFSGPIALQWSDAFGKSANDYDLYVLNSLGTDVVDSSTDLQNGDGDPLEIVGPQSYQNQVVVVKYSGQPRFLNLNTNRGRLAISTTGSTGGHSAAVDAFSVAAVSARRVNHPFIGGAANPVETFSSDGPRRVFYSADGTPITPDDFLSSGGAVRQKPDIAAADGVATTLPSFTGLNLFYGTSAAAPHAAGVAALLKSFRADLTTAQLRTVLTTSALDIEDPGVDVVSGSGIVMAEPALKQAQILPTNN